MKGWVMLLTTLLSSSVQGWVNCPSWIQNSGKANDLAKISDVVSWNDHFESVHGVCGEYHMVGETWGIYDTRMQIYEKSQDDVVIVFRPTQQTNAGGDIHVDRKLVPCRFFDGCKGLVHDRFQEAFLQLIGNLPENFLESTIRGKNVSLTGHSLGGSLQLFMALYIWKTFDTKPDFSFGFAGPFIGDEEFTNAHQIPFKNTMGDKWWQIEAVNRFNSWDVDTTAEGYQVDQAPYLYIEQDAICRLPVDHLSYSYGMHDLRNYQTGVKGTLC